RRHTRFSRDWSSDVCSSDLRVVAVTGGAGMLGTVYARALAAAGAHVVVADIDGDAAAELAAAVTRESGVRALGVRVDVTDKASRSEERRAGDESRSRCWLRR